jgi:hypothetical protein
MVSVGLRIGAEIRGQGSVSWFAKGLEHAETDESGIDLGSIRELLVEDRVRVEDPLEPPPDRLTKDVDV